MLVDLIVRLADTRACERTWIGLPGRTCGFLGRARRRSLGDLCGGDRQLEGTDACEQRRLGFSPSQSAAGGAVTPARDLRSRWWLGSQQDEENRLRRLSLPA